MQSKLYNTTMLLNVYKPKGLTPLQVIEQIRKKFLEYKDEKIGYAGRLDPLAHGVLLLMMGEETTRQKDKYLNLPKEYEFEAVFGVSTDTFDALGILNNLTTRVLDNNKLKDAISNFVKKKLGKHEQPYPSYSSKTVNGKPLFQWARENKLMEIKIPKREIEIYDFKLIELKEISAKKFEEEIFQQINSVTGDFRQKEIKQKWSEFFKENKTTVFRTASFKISCSSGTYVRSIVNELGKYLGCNAITLEISRTKVGNYKLDSSIKLF